MSKELLIFVGIVFVVVLVAAIIMNNRDPDKSIPTIEERQEIAYNLGAKVRKVLFWVVLGIPAIIIISILKAVKMQK